jgi:hypothetical protein
MELKNLLTLGWNRRRQKAASRYASNQPKAPTFPWFAIQGHIFLFACDWELSPYLGNKNSELQRQRKEGKLYYALSAYEDCVAYFSELPPGKGSKYAAALHLADRQSQGGIEIFCFLIKEDLYSFIALNDSKPVPGHDYIGSKENVLQLAEDFAILQEQQAIRYVGNSGLFEMEESLSLDKAFSSPDSLNKIKTILNQSLILSCLAAVALVYVAHVGIDYYLSQLQIEEEAARQALLNDPNTLYEKQIDQALQKTGPAGEGRIATWLKTIGKLPLKVAGWRLTYVKCASQECTASWQREYGNFSELFSGLPVAMTASNEIMEPTKPGVSTATTTHAVAAEANPQPLTRENLPKSNRVLRIFSSQLQDISLLENTSLAMEKPKLFPDNAQGNLETLQRPVIRGAWTITHDLWSLDSLKLQPFVVAESLELQFPSSPIGSVVYSLKGSYYALHK